MKPVPTVFEALSRLVDKAHDWEAAIVSQSADRECEHGRLPGDATPPCGCWPEEVEKAA